MKNSAFTLPLMMSTVLATSIFVVEVSAAGATEAVQAAAVANSPAAVVVPNVAKKAVAGMMPGCSMREQVSINVQYNFRANSFAEAKKMFDEQNAKVTDYAKKQEVAKFELQNQNYNINAQPQNYGPDGQPQNYIYQVNGNSSYVMDNADAAFKFAEYLNSQKIQVGMNSNSYRQGNCNNY